jgi:hypothetical protein
MQNDTVVFDAMAFNPITADYDIWKGVGTREAIEAAGYRVVEAATLKWRPKETLKGGWALRI